MNKSLLWVDFYMELADKLRTFSEDRAALIDRVKQVYQVVQMPLPTLEKDNEIEDIDPFTVFGTFNKGITDANRSALLQGYAQVLGLQKEVPSAFAGVPVLNNQKATFYNFKGDREEHDIDTLWNVFLAALDYAQTQSNENRAKLASCFDAAAQIKGVKWNLTMALFWIRPYEYLNLDGRSRWFIFLPGKMPQSFIEQAGKLTQVPSGEDYLLLTDAAKEALQTSNYPYKNFPELSYNAWTVSQRVNEEKRAHQVQAQRNCIGEGLADQDVDTVTIHYWLYSPGNNACMWDEFREAGIMAIRWGEIGDLRDFTSKQEMKDCMKQQLDASLSYKNAAHATWQFANEIKPGDIVFVKKGLHEIVGRGIVSSDYEYDADREDSYKHIRKVKWTHTGTWPHPGQAVTKTLTDITPYPDYVKTLCSYFVDDDLDEEEPPELSLPVYSREDFLRDVYMDEVQYDTLSGLLYRKQNIILQGAPGVGKTYVAQRLAYSLMGVKDKSRVMMVQFHQNYGYEDFVMGFRPTPDGTGFKLREGPFYKFCKAAEIDNENDYFFIIDEINRGNLSKIFGELFMMIEKDKRGNKLQLLYADEMFSIPENVYIIGTMNTADRSLALIDYALRRRFAFFDMQPAFESEQFKASIAEKHNEKLSNLIRVVKLLNGAISEDAALGRGFCIGHSYFCTTEKVDDDWLHSVVAYELVPLLQEYWFDDPQTVNQWELKLNEAIR